MNAVVFAGLLAGIIVAVVVISNVNKDSPSQEVTLPLTCAGNGIQFLASLSTPFNFSATDFQSTPQYLSLQSWNGETLLSTQLFNEGAGFYTPSPGTTEVYYRYQCNPTVKFVNCDSAPDYYDFDVVAAFYNTSQSTMQVLASDGENAASQTVLGEETSGNFFGYSIFSFSCVGPDLSWRIMNCPGKSFPGALSLTDGAQIPVSNTFNLPISLFQHPYGGGKAVAEEVAAGGTTIVDGSLYESINYFCPDIFTLTCQGSQAIFAPTISTYLQSIVPTNISVTAWQIGVIDAPLGVSEGQYVGGDKPILFQDLTSISIEGCPSLSIINTCDENPLSSGFFDGFDSNYYVFNAGDETSVSGVVFGSGQLFDIGPGQYLSISYAVNVADGGIYSCSDVF